jgi:hypothetical protein
MQINIKRWLNFVVVFILLMGLWISLAAASASQLVTDAFAAPTPVPGLLEPGNPTFALIIVAIIIVTIVTTSSIFRNRSSR